MGGFILTSMSENLHNQIMRALGNLEGKVDGINNRLDVLNGRVAKHDERLGNLDISDSKQNIKLGIIGTVAGLVGSFILSQFK